MKNTCVARIFSNKYQMTEQELTDERIIAQTRAWVETVIVGLNFCPFAKREVVRNSIDYRVVHDDMEQAVTAVIAACQQLDENQDIETALLIYVGAFEQFDDYLDMLELANALISAQGYEGIYQLASFHPRYCFEGSDDEAAENYTNRSPYPMLHLIREASLELALESYSEPEKIPQRNIQVAKDKGVQAMQAMLDACINNDKPIKDEATKDN